MEEGKIIIFYDRNVLDRYLSKFENFQTYSSASAFHAVPAVILMQTITVCGLLYCKQEFLSDCDFVSAILIIMILCQHASKGTGIGNSGWGRGGGGG